MSNKLPYKPQFELIVNNDRLKEVVSILSKCKVIGIDTETTGLDPHLAKVLLVQIADQEKCYIFDCEKVDICLLKELLEDTDILKLLQNAKFDYKMLKASYDIKIKNIFCTMSAERLINAGISGFKSSLKVLADKYLGIALDKEIRKQFVETAGYQRAGFSDEELEYAANDALILFPIYEQQVTELIDRELVEVALLEFSVIEVTAEMELVGVLINTDRWKEIVEQVNERREETQHLIFREFSSVVQQNNLFGAPVININSSKQLLSYLSKLGVKTKSGEPLPSTDESVLSEIKDKYHIIKLLLDYKGDEKVVTTYGKALLKKINQKTGRLHATFDQLRAATGRYSSSSPNLQNIPAYRGKKDFVVSDRVTIKKEFLLDLNVSSCGPYMVEKVVKDNKKGDGIVFLSGINKDTSMKNLIEYPMIDFRSCFVAKSGRKLITADYCVAPETRVLTGDLRWVRIDKVSIGDELIGVEEYPTNKQNTRVLKPTIVEKKTLLKQPGYEILLDDGSKVRCSDKHRWLVKVKNRYQWVQTKDIVLGNKLGRYIDPWDVDYSWESGYLAGVFDGEGTVHINTKRREKAGSISFYQRPGVVLEEVHSCMNKLNFSFSGCKVGRGNFIGSKGDLNHLWFSGMNNMLRFIGTVRPKRFLEKSRPIWENRIPRRGTKSVVGIKYLGEIDVVGIQTTERTFIAEGLISHNSQQELRILADASGDPVFARAYQNNEDIHTRTAADIFNVPLEKVTKAQRTQAKQINFALVYGAGPWKISKSLNITEQEAARLIEKYFETYPKIKNFLQGIADFAVRNRYSYTITGRKRYFSIPDGSHPEYKKIIGSVRRQAANTYIQGCLGYNSDVITRDGVFKIGDMVNKRADFWTGTSFKRGRVVYSGEKTLFEISTSPDVNFGSKLRLTKDHKLLVWDFKTASELWKPLKDARCGNLIACNSPEYNREFVFLVSVNCVGVGPCYDVKLDEEPHCFVANGIVCHNSAADVTKLAMKLTYDELNKKGLDANLVLIVHDEIVLDVEESIAKEVAELLEKCMLLGFSSYFKTIPMMVDAVIKNFWSKD